jgi:hypothetical protein
LVVSDGDHIRGSISLESGIAGRAAEEPGKSIVVDKERDRLIDENLGVSAGPEGSVTPSNGATRVALQVSIDDIT